MSGKLTRRGFVAVAGGLLLGGALAGTALAQQAPQDSWSPGACPMGGGPGFGPGAGMQGTMPAAIAGALGLSSDELQAALRSGKTVAQIAQEKGIALDSVVEAAEKAHDEALAAQVQAGRLTQEQADWMDGRMEANLKAMLAGGYGPGTMRGAGFGPGMGPGMGPGFGPGMGPGMGPGFGPGMGPRRHGPGMMPGFGPWRQGQ